jgi:hypothetical protein
LGEDCLVGGYDDLAVLVRERGLTDVPDDMIDAVNLYIAYCTELMERSELYWIERKLVHNPELFGTADFIALTVSEHEGYTLHVVDYKHGAGVLVDPYQNRQLLTYAGLVMLDKGLNVDWESITAVELIIVQPRANTTGNTISVWATDMAEVNGNMGEVFNAIEDSKMDDAPMASGDHCRWCRAKPICPQLEKEAQGLIAMKPKDLTPEQLTEGLDRCNALEMAIKDLREYAAAQMVKGLPIPHYKMVAKRGVAKWADETAATLYMFGLKKESENIYTTKLITPAQARKLVGKAGVDGLNEFIKTESSGNVLVHESDKREAVLNANTISRMATQMAAHSKKVTKK